jgi:hypothetical protein
MSLLTSTSAADFAKEVMGAIDEGTKQGIRMFWDATISVLREHLLATTLIFLVILAIALIKTIAGRWGMLGSVLYNLFYFGTLLIIGLIWGPSVFASDFFHMACTLILYPISFFITGMILDELGVRRGFRNR